MKPEKVRQQSRQHLTVFQMIDWQRIIATAKKTGLYETTLDVKKPSKNADIVYSDTWVDMEFFLD